MVANRYIVEHIVVERAGFGGAELGLWTIRRFGWVLGAQPSLFGLILLSRNEWSLGAVSLTVAVITITMSELVTVGLDGRKDRNTTSRQSRSIIDTIANDMLEIRDDSANSTRRPRTSDASMLHRLTTLLPGYSRLPSDCRLPLQTENIDDLVHTERASYTRPAPANQNDDRQRRFYHEPTESLRGLIYPPEILAPIPVVWLSNDGAGVALREATDLQRNHGIATIVDPDHPDIAKSQRKSDFY